MVVEHWTSCVLVACIGIRRTELTIVDSALGSKYDPTSKQAEFSATSVQFAFPFWDEKNFCSTPSPSKMTTVLGIWCAFTR
jgi:hypothetical protein